MRILVLTKRQYTGRDLMEDRYGRLFEIPKSLAQLGHQVRGLALSYRRRTDGCPPPEEAGGVLWETMNALPFSPMGAARHLKRIRDVCQRFRPDVVWTSSDAWHAIATRITCPPLGIPYVVDLYDNYECFGLSRIPGVTSLFRRACRSAGGLTPIGSTLADYLQSHYLLPPELPCLCLGNAVDTGQFRPIDKQVARQALGLAPTDILIGTAGALDAGRGIATLLEAYAQLLAAYPSLRLVLAGPRDHTLERFRHLPICDLGVLPASRVPLFWNALDVAVIQNRDSAFGKYCYPQKLQEIVACGVPLVASDVGEVRILLDGFPECLAEPDSPTALAALIAAQINQKNLVDRSKVRTWDQRADELSVFLEGVASYACKRQQSFTN